MTKQVKKTLGVVLKSAKKEFLEKGFEKASMRTIAKNAGVTTGAIYVRFPNKDALFGALVEPLTNQWSNIFVLSEKTSIQLVEDGRPQDMWNISDRMISKVIDSIYSNRDAFMLIACHATGSSYDNIMDKLSDAELKQTIMTRNIMQEKGYKVADISKKDLEILVSSHFYAMFQVYINEKDKQKAIERIKTVNEFFKAGWMDIFGFASAD